MARLVLAGNIVTSVAPTCNTDVLAVANASWTQGAHYWEIGFTMWSCLARAGVVCGTLDASKFGGGHSWSPANPPLLGALENTWACGTGPNCQACNFTPLDRSIKTSELRIGLLLEIEQQKLHIFFAENWVTTISVSGTGVWRPAVQLCHKGHSAQLLPATQVPQRVN